MARPASSWIDDYIDWLRIDECCKMNITDGTFCPSSKFLYMDIEMKQKIKIKSLFFKVPKKRSVCLVKENFWREIFDPLSLHLENIYHISYPIYLMKIVPKQEELHMLM